jgi:GST-like protein
MIDLHYWPTPNGWKITIMLEEAELPYAIVPVDIGRGAQLTPEFLAISPNNRMPAIVDRAPVGGGEPIAIFESAAILQYLAEKSGRFMPKDARGKYAVLQWLAWQVAHLGPSSGQNYHFRNYAAEKIPYAVERFGNEVNRLYGVLERRLAESEFLAGDYSIADMAAWPWMLGHEGQGQVLAEFPSVKRWMDAVAARPAVEKGRRVGSELRKSATLDDEARRSLFGQTAKSVTATVPRSE